MLVGILNCVVVEPALAQFQEHHATAAAEEGGHCDFICHSFHHQWIATSPNALIHEPSPSQSLVSERFYGSPEPPLRNIFHPPLVLA